MIVSVEKRFVFLGNRKCASTAILSEIGKDGNLRTSGPDNLRHTSYRAFERFIIPFLEARLGLTRADFTVVSIFREPIDHLHSFYRYRSRRRLADPRHKNHARYTGGITFEEFVAGYPTDPHPGAVFESQADFVSDRQGNVGPDLLLKFDELDDAVDQIGQLLGRRLRLKRRNISPRIPLVLADDTRARLRESLQRDYEIYEAIGATC